MPLIEKLAKVDVLNRTAKGAINRLPWFVRKVVLDAIHNGVVNRPSFEGVYGRLEDVANVVYPSDQARAEFVRSGLSVHHDEANGLVVLRGTHMLLPLLVATLKTRDRPIRVLDFGGSGGIDFLGVRESVGAEIDYRVVELPAVCAICREFWAGESRISFSEALPPEHEKFDIVYSWSSVQYADDPVDLITKFAAYEPKAILIAGSPFGERAFVRAQVGRGTRVPQWVTRLADVESRMRDAGYRLTLRAVDDKPYNVDNFDPQHRVGSSAILLFTPDKA